MQSRLNRSIIKVVLQIVKFYTVVKRILKLKEETNKDEGFCQRAIIFKNLEMLLWSYNKEI